MIPQYENETFEEVETNKHLSKITILLLISKIFLLGLVAFRKYKKRQIARYQVENYSRIETGTDEESLNLNKSISKLLKYNKSTENTPCYLYCILREHGRSQ